MASDPRFDPYGNECVERQQRRSKWTTCLIGCLVVSGVALIVCDRCRVWVGRQLARLGGGHWHAGVGSGDSELRFAASGEDRSEGASRPGERRRFAMARSAVEQVGMIMQKVYSIAADAGAGRGGDRRALFRQIGFGCRRESAGQESRSSDSRGA